MLCQSAFSHLRGTYSHYDKVLIDGISQDVYHLRERVENSIAREVHCRLPASQVIQDLGRPSDT